MKIVELILDEENDDIGVSALSLVENPAIEEDWIALKSQEVKFEQVDKEKRILMGAALVPNRPIYRKSDDGEEFYIFFNKQTVEKASQMFFVNGNQSNSTLEHKYKLDGMTVVESWIIENKDKDKSAHYGMDLPEGTWMVSMKVNDDDIWNNYIKTKKVKGFSIEAFMSEKATQRPKDKTIDEKLAEMENQEAEFMMSEVKDMLGYGKKKKKKKKYNMESFSDYPSGVKNNAKRGIELNEKNGNKCATQVGKVRATQLAQGKAVSVETVKRMYSYLSRAMEYYDESDSSACGTISVLLWGGKSALRWSGSKLRELDLLSEMLDDDNPCEAGYEMVGMKMKNGRRVPNCVPLESQELKTMIIDTEMAIIDDRLAYSSQTKAEEKAKDLGCEGFHTHDLEGQTWYMPCQTHKQQ
jgi:hypothetical protein